ncbi:MAG: FGGY-family carbohydrate kinase [Microcella pacifica]|uniref:FGGY-family carbohydrate kinase n=1 Tax=Microcella pacifica TaxID=2591847 RepID=UPI0033149018
MEAVLGVDIGTSSSKGTLVDLDGRIIAIAVREHSVSRPRPGWVEADPNSWWDEFCSISRELSGGHDIVAVAVSGMGPCVSVADATGVALRPAILYGVDTRATAEIAELERQLTAAKIMERCGSALSTQSAGPKIAWIRDNEPEVFIRARKFFMPSSWLAFHLTGEYILDHHSASQCTPLYDRESLEWYRPWADPIVGAIELPRLVWADSIIGTVQSAAANSAGLREGTPVVAGTIDAWAEAISVGAHEPGGLMLMYGTTMFLINTIVRPLRMPGLWGTVGAFEGSHNLAGGMATSGAITAWLRDLFGSPDYSELLARASESPPGARGLLMLPYFAGERTPIPDPHARGVIAGLTIEHSRGDLYRSALEATALGVRHNVEAIRDAGGAIDRVTAVGGGAQSDVWMHIVSDVTGVDQQVPRTTVGASFGAAYLAATAVSSPEITRWNPIERTIEANPDNASTYSGLFELYRELYLRTAPIVHSLAARQHSTGR